MRKRPALGLASLAFLGLVGLAQLATPVLASNTENFGFNRAVHWSDVTGTLAAMEFIDHTPSSWPVFSAASEWNRTSSLVITYRYGSATGCPRHCVGVRAEDMGDCGSPYGRTNPEFSTQAHMAGATNVRLNSRCVGPLNDAGRREIACHELGHAAGWIGHRSGSCMRTGAVVGPLQRFPSEHDFSMFPSPLYNHND